MGMLALAAALAMTHTFTYDAEVLPNRAWPPWSFREIKNCSAAIEDGVLHVRDDGAAQGELQFVSYPWMAIADRPHSVEARVKVASCSGPAGVIILAADGVREVGLTLFPDRIEIHRLDARAEVNLADDFHVVRLEMVGDDAVVKVDGKLVLDLTGRSSWDAHAGRNVVGFGSLSSAATGEAWWDHVTWSAEQPEVEAYQRAQHHIVFKQEGVYACFPSVHQYEDGTLVSGFGTRVRRSHIDNTGGSARMVSRDGGITWEKADAGASYYNPAMVRVDGHLTIANAIGWRYVDEGEMERLNAEGRTVRAVRPGTVAYLSGARSMVRSINGETWSEPVDTGIWGYPAHLLLLPDGRLLATYGYRRAPMGIRACLSRDGGKSWDIEDEIILRADGFGSGSDLGYPITQRLADGTLATIYYFNGVDGITHVCLTRWTPPAE